LRWHYTNKL
ncbi:hypothetical protein JVL15_13445, partial [Klebsiella quasipneumoniae]